MYAYVQMFFKSPDMWHIVGEENTDLVEALEELASFQAENPKDQFRIVAYPESAGNLKNDPNRHEN